jgi:hypothetical protein
MPFYFDPSSASKGGLIPLPKKPDKPRAVCLEFMRMKEASAFHERFQRNFGSLAQMAEENMVIAASSASEKPCIGIKSLFSCLGIAIYDEKHLVGGIAHIYLDPEVPDLEATRAMLENLVDLADALGGKSYFLSSFNCTHGRRIWNHQLIVSMNSLVIGLIEQDKVSGFSHRDERDFVLDVRTGNIFTGAES